MKKVFLTSVVLGLALLTGDLSAQVYSSCDQWATYSTGGYNLYNNIWGSGAGTQCIYINNYNDWYIVADHPNTSGVKSYPNVERPVDLYVDNMGSVTSSFNVSVPSGGSYEATYDIWYDNYAYEIMLWMYYTGSVGPIANSYSCNGACPSASNVSIGGNTWNVYQGNNGSNAVFSFLRTSNTTSGTVDIAAISQWLRTQGWFGNAHLHSIQFGFEISGTNGSQTYSVNNFSVSTGGSSSSSSGGSSSGGSSGGCTPTSITPYIQINGGAWQQTSSVTVSSGSSVKFGPQPASGGSWSWSGCATSGTSREQTVYPTSSCTSTATYTNSCGAQSTQNFTVTVSGSSSSSSGGSSSSSSGGGTGNITVRARGTSGSESIQLKANGNTVATWTLSTGYQNYTASGSGTISVQFTNDASGRDVQVDYVVIDGTTYQAEDQAVNTGVWQNSQCGGSYSEWLHCNGYIQFNSGGSSSSSSSSSSGSSSSSSSSGSSGGGSSSGGTCSPATSISYPFSHDGSGEFCWVTSQQYNYVNSWAMTTLTINGADYANIWSNTLPAAINGNYYIHYVGSAGWSHVEFNGPKDASSQLEDINTKPLDLIIYPNPVSGKTINIVLSGMSDKVDLKLFDAQGNVIKAMQSDKNRFLKMDLDIASGVYIMQAVSGEKSVTKKIIIE